VLLAIETSTTIGSVALGDGAGVLAEVVLGEQSRHAEAVAPAVDTALKLAGRSLDGLDGVVVGGGPGSFTGVRVGGATAKGLVRALGVPLYAYSGLLALAASVSQEAAVCALFDARRGEVYAACYRLGDEVDTLLQPGVAHLDQVLDAVAAHDPVYAGDGAWRYAEVIEGRGGRPVAPHRGVPRASALLWLADRWPDLGRVADPAAWEPAYLREPGARRGVRG